MKIAIKGIPPSLNTFLGSSDPWKYRQAKSEWTQKAYWLSKNAYHGEPMERATVTITYYFSNGNRHDADNYCGKLFMDGFVKARVLKDDDLKHITVVIKGAVDKKNPRVEIEIEEDA